MSSWDYERFKRSLADSQELESLYLLFGEETYLVEESLRTLVGKAIGDSLKDFNYDVFFAAGVVPDQILDVVATLPMMAPRRVVVLKEIQDLKAKDLEVLLPLVTSPVSSTVLVLVGSKIDQRLKFFKEAQKKGISVKFDRPFPNQLPYWIKHIATQNGKDISGEAIELINQWVGPGLLEINSEMQKLSQFLGDRRRIEVADVENVVTQSRWSSVFALAHAVGARDRSAALFCLAQLLDQGESAVGILAMVARHFRILTLVKDGVQQGLTSAQLASRAGVSSYFLKDYIGQSREWTDSRLRQTYDSLLVTDRALKSSRVSDHIWLENFVLSVCQTPPNA